MKLKYDIDEIIYSNKEELEVRKELNIALCMQILSKKTSKTKLKNWFAKLQIEKNKNKKKWNGWCNNITGQDLTEIAISVGMEVLK